MFEEFAGTNHGELEYERLRWHIDLAVRVLANECNGDCAGGTFCLLSPSGSGLFAGRFGKVSADSQKKHHSFAVEQAVRLACNLDHILSWQSKNEPRGMFPGAVRAPNGLIGSFFGFTAEENEALVLWVLTKMDWMDRQEAWGASVISSNSRHASLVQKFNQAKELAV